MADIKKHNYAASFAMAGSIMTILFFIIINYTTNCSYPWFIYPSFAVLWWPVSVFFAGRHSYKAFSIVGCILIITFLTTINLVYSPQCLWVLYAGFPALLWPAVAFAGKKAGSVKISFLCSAVTIIYYASLNILMSPSFPWAIFPAYAVLWWPLSILFANKKMSLHFSIAGAVLTSALFIAVNAFTTPNQIWAVYPIFAVLWWPLSVYFFVHKKDIVKQ